MKAEHLSDAIGKLDEVMISEAEQVRRKKRKPRWIAWVAAAACIAIAVALVRPLILKEDQQTKVPLGKPDNTILYHSDSTSADQLIAYANYPKMEQYPNGENYLDRWEAYNEAYEAWLSSRHTVRASAQQPEDVRYFDDFYQASALAFLSSSEEENLVYSPSNVYMALAMLAELTDGQSRQQILELLGVENMQELRTQTKYLWMSNYSDDGMLTTVMANSLWLSEGISYERDTMELLAREYYASSYSGVMGSEEYNALLRDWLNRQTGDLLQEQVQELSFDPSTVMALASTIYFKGQWSEAFRTSQTQPDTFYAATGETTVDFMHSSDVGFVYWGESYTAIEKNMENGASMWLILPDADKSVTDVLSDGEVFQMTSAGVVWEQNKAVTINLAMPKFDVSSNMDLIEGLQGLGITDVFDSTVSDFTPMTEQLDGIYVSSVDHAARVMVDEEGCTAAAYTVMMTECADAICEDEIDFVLDRPFIFVITGCGDQPLFIGVVNQV